MYFVYKRKDYIYTFPYLYKKFYYVLDVYFPVSNVKARKFRKVGLRRENGRRVFRAPPKAGRDFS